jgi:hypothetical protein
MWVATPLFVSPSSGPTPTRRSHHDLFPRKGLVTCLTPLALAFACNTMPAKAPRSNPGDMTPEEHRQASAQEASKASQHQSEAESVQPTKPAVQNAAREDHERQAERHQKYSEQHSEAAEAPESAAGK